MSGGETNDVKRSVDSSQPSDDMNAAFASAPLRFDRESAENPIDPLLQQLIDIVGPIYREIRRRKKGDSTLDEKINDEDDPELLVRLGHILEASMGDIHLAAALFLDDYVASTALAEPSGSSRSLPGKLHSVNRKSKFCRYDDTDNSRNMDPDRNANYKKGYSDEEDAGDILHGRHVRNIMRSQRDELLKNMEHSDNDDHVSDKRYNTQGLSFPNDPNANAGKSEPNLRSDNEPVAMAAPDRYLPLQHGDIDINEDIQIRPQENPDDNLQDARVSVSDDETTSGIQQNLSSLRKKLLDSNNPRYPPSSRKWGRWKMEQLDEHNYLPGSKRFKRQNSTSSSYLNPDQCIPRNGSPNEMKSSRRSSTSDCSSFCGSALDMSHLDENFSGDDDGNNDDDNHSDKAVYQGINENPRRHTFDYVHKYEDLFETNNDFEPSILLWGIPSRNKDPESDPSVIEDIASQMRLQPPPLNDARIHDVPIANLAHNNSSRNATLPSMDDVKKLSTIPWTWLGCGFQLSPCGTGLVLPQPNVETLQKISKVHAMHRKLVSSILPGKIPPTPVAYCGAVTALVSLVTALLYSGVTVLGNEVNCNVDRKPFAELSLDERRLEFPRRLSDALSAILFIAAKRHSEKRRFAISLVESELRKERQQLIHQVNDRNSSDVFYDYSPDPCRDDCESMIKQVLQRQSRLIPVCRWELEENNMKKPLRLSISMSNIADLRSYVLSNISQYMSPGGCALLLETLVHIYGRNRLARAVKKQRRKAGKKPYMQSLISCNCVEGQFNTWQQQELITKDKSSSTTNINQLQSVQPVGHQCLSIEILSVILTGQVETSISNWLTEFGIGMLCSDKVEGEHLGKSMKFPLYPIWLVRGISRYSVLWHKELSRKTGDLTEPFSSVHWHCWYTGHNKSVLNVIPSSFGNSEGIIDSSNEMGSQRIDEFDIRHHPDDEKIYPDNFQRWRFSLMPLYKQIDDNERGKDSNDIWLPYYRLNQQQKEAVDRKMSTDINLAIWSRWKAAVIEIDQDNSNI